MIAKAVKLGVRRLRYNLVEDLELGMCPDPVSDRFAEGLGLTREHERIR